jgi:hypothetical protein
MYNMENNIENEFEVEEWGSERKRRETESERERYIYIGRDDIERGEREIEREIERVKERERDGYRER